MVDSQIKVDFEIWLTYELWWTLELWLTFDIAIKWELWLIFDGGTDTHKQTKNPTYERQRIFQPMLIEGLI